MKNKLIILLLSFITLVSFSSCNIGINIVNYKDDKIESNKQFDYKGNYTEAELKVDGIMDEKQWESSTEELSFGSHNQCKMVMYRGENALFCFFTVTDKDIETVGNNNGDDVTKGDSVEVYFDFKNDGAMKPQTDDIQINIGAHGKTRIFVGSGGNWGPWNGLLDYQVVLNGTTNNNKDEDEGYTVELMIPYAQIGINKDSVFGVTCGHVSRGKDSTHETLPYTWGGLFHKGNFIEPQCPAVYLLSSGKHFYPRGEEPIDSLTFNGKVVDIDNNPIKDATIKIGTFETTTSSNGKYNIENVNYSEISTIEIIKDGYQTYLYDIPTYELRKEEGKVTLDACLLEVNEDKKITLTGKVVNPLGKDVDAVEVYFDSNVVTTSSNGEFSIEVTPKYDLTATLIKEGYKVSTNRIVLKDLIGKSIYDVGSLSLFNNSSFATFGGQRRIPSVEAEIYRGHNDLNIIFETNKEITDGSRIELFIDTKTSFYGRDYTDYKIDVDSDGSIYIKEFGSILKKDVFSSGVKTYRYSNNNSHYIELIIPYSFLNVTNSEILGISMGIYDASLDDWDGWAFSYGDFEDYVAPEYSEEYCRINLDNELYRAKNNKLVKNWITGIVKNKAGKVITNGTVNKTPINKDGTFKIIGNEDEDTELVIEVSGYEIQTVTISKDSFVDGKYFANIVLANTPGAMIKGTCNIEGAKVYLHSNPDIYTYVVSGSYELEVPTYENAKIVFEAENYQSKTISIGKVALIQSADTEIPIVRNVILESN